MATGRHESGRERPTGSGGRMHPRCWKPPGRAQRRGGCLAAANGARRCDAVGDVPGRGSRREGKGARCCVRRNRVRDARRGDAEWRQENVGGPAARRAAGARAGLHSQPGRAHFRGSTRDFRRVGVNRAGELDCGVRMEFRRRRERHRRRGAAPFSQPRRLYSHADGGQRGRTVRVGQQGSCRHGSPGPVGTALRRGLCGFGHLDCRGSRRWISDDGLQVHAVLERGRCVGAQDGSARAVPLGEDDLRAGRGRHLD